MQSWLLLVVLVIAACDRVRFATVTLSPAPSASIDSVRLPEPDAQRAFALASRLATRHGLDPHVPTHSESSSRSSCFLRASLLFCMKSSPALVEFRLSEMGAQYGEPLRRELVDSLRSQFGESSIRASDWR